MMSRSALFAALAVGVCSVLGPSASGASLCGMSPARQAFDVEGLKSELMVTALSCNEQDHYNAFVAKFRPDLNEEERALNAYFKQSYGRGAQKQHDAYITQLANVQSERGLQAGTQFCSQRASMFGEIAVLESASDLSGYAEAKDIVQPATFDTCAAPVAEHETTRPHRVRTVRRHRKA